MGEELSEIDASTAHHVIEIRKFDLIVQRGIGIRPPHAAADTEELPVATVVYENRDFGQSFLRSAFDPWRRVGCHCPLSADEGIDVV